MSSEQALAGGSAALAAGRWAEARRSFERALAQRESPQALFGLAMALWWLGESQLAVTRCARAHVLFHRSGAVPESVQTAVWLAITYKANFANFTAANGWLARAERLLAPLPEGALHGWAWVARAYRMGDLDLAERLTTRAVELAASTGDHDLELVARSQLGLIQVGQGHAEAGFGLIDEAMAAALAGEGSTLDTVVYTACDMLNACELVADIRRATQWCAVADTFVHTYGCPFLYAECRITFGSVLASQGRWAEAERELQTGLQIARTSSTGLHARATLRLAGLRVRQGRLEEAEHLLSGVAAGTEAEHALCSAALALARGRAERATQILEPRPLEWRGQRWPLASALDLLVDACLASGDRERAASMAARLAAGAGPESHGQDCRVGPTQLSAMAAGAQGRVALASGDEAAAVRHLQAAAAAWAELTLPYDLARTRFELARALLSSQPDAAIDLARRALAAMDRMGATAEADPIAAFLRRLGVTPRTGVRGTTPLTVREREVLRLLAAGLTNPEIANRLHITRKTAAHHVSNILTKLGLRNRAEAAAHAAALLDPGAVPEPALPPS